METDLALLHRALVEHFRRDRFWGEVDALLLCLLQYGGEQAHFELEREHVHAGRPALAAFGDDFLHEQTAHGQVDRADDYEPPAVLTMEKGGIR